MTIGQLRSSCFSAFLSSTTHSDDGEGLLERHSKNHCKQRMTYSTYQADQICGRTALTDPLWNEQWLAAPLHYINVVKAVISVSSTRWWYDIDQVLGIVNIWGIEGSMDRNGCRVMPSGRSPVKNMTILFRFRFRFSRYCADVQLPNGGILIKSTPFYLGNKLKMFISEASWSYEWRCYIRRPRNILQ